MHPALIAKTTYGTIPLMHQVLQNYRTGAVLVANRFSLISAGTERVKVETGKACCTDGVERACRCSNTDFAIEEVHYRYESQGL
ncbi:MAG: hypothetical protein KatS3mg016_1445 [Fimbriimonadales bacterium]|nr:MAG: hypothetical protein KatS3mg016_1445 [Fimbriimonadales bacterium]